MRSARVTASVGTRRISGTVVREWHRLASSAKRNLLRGSSRRCSR